MRFVLYTNALSEHQIPLAKEIVKIVGDDNFQYIYTSKMEQKLQESNASDNWIHYVPMGSRIHNNGIDCDEWLENADIMLVGGIRPIDLIERRLSRCKTTLYMSERWFKPIPVFRLFYMPGWLRLLSPKYWRMARRFTNLFMQHEYRFLPIGPWSLYDMKLICRIMGIKIPEKQVIMWGDFVESSKIKTKCDNNVKKEKGELKVLWVGRLLKWKRVDTIIKAVGILSTSSINTFNYSLDIYGTGSEKKRLSKLAAKYGDSIQFYPPVSIAEVRRLMHEHDVYVLASNACEGWGAVVNEALEEGMKVLGTYEAGASAAILPQSNLYHSGDWRSLAEKLSNTIQSIPIGNWSTKRATERLFEELGQ